MVQSSLPEVDALVRRCSELDAQAKLGRLGDPEAAAFFSDFSMERLMRTFQAGSMDAASVGLVASVLSRLLASELGRGMLPTLLPYLTLASQAAAAPLRTLAANLLTQLLHQQQRGQGSGTAQEAEAAALQLLRQLQDADTAVAASAEAGLVSWACAAAAAPALLLLPTQEAGTVGSLLRTLIRDGRAPADAGAGAGAGAGAAPCADAGTVKARALAVALKAAAAVGSAESAALLHASGLLDHLAASLAQAASDLLSALSLLALLQEAAGGVAPMAGGGSGSIALGAALHDRLVPLLQPLLSDPLLGPGAMMLTACLLRAALEHAAATANAGATTATASSSPAAHPFLCAVAAALDPEGDVGPDDEAAALDAAGCLGLSRRGAEALLGCSPQPAAQSPHEKAAAAAEEAQARGRLIASALLARSLAPACPTPGLRLAALHATAAVAGAERAPEAGERRAALLAPGAEARLREAAYAACGGAGAATPGEALSTLLRSPVAEQRAAVYRLITALAVRPWFAAEVARHASLLQRLLAVGSEGGASATAVEEGTAAGRAQHVRGAEWRHAAVHSLWLTAQAVASADGTGGGSSMYAAEEVAGTKQALAAVLPQLQQAVEEGPHGVAGRGRRAAANGVHDHQVATLP